MWTAIAYHGNGVAMASWCGRALARMLVNQHTRAELPKVLTRRLAKFPLPALRLFYLKAAYLWFNWRDSR